MQISLGGIGLGAGAIIWLIRMLSSSKGNSAVSGLGSLLKSGITTGADTGGEIDPRFKTHYEQFIRPQVDVFETERLAALAELRRRSFIVGPILIGISVLALAFLGVHGGGLLLIVYAVGCGWAGMPVIQYKGSIKEKIFSQVFKFYGPEWSYQPKGLDPSATISDGGTALADTASEVVNRYRLLRTASADSNATGSKWIMPNLPGTGLMAPYMPYGILPKHDRAKSSDYICGGHKTVPLSLLQCVLERESNNNDNRSSETVFHGLVIELSVPKRFSGHTVVKRDQGKVGNWFGKKFAGEMQTVRLEDPRFEKRYEVYGTDQVEARYLLTNTFMERLVALEDMFAAGNGTCAIQCAFKDGKLLVMIPSTKQWFSPGSVFQPASFVDDINLVLQEMDQLFAIIDVLKLDDRSGL